MIEVKFLEAAEVKDGGGVVIQAFKAGQVKEMSNASARHWINRGIAFDVQAAARAAREAKQPEETAEPKGKGKGRGKAKKDPEAKTGDAGPTSRGSGPAKPSSA